MNGPSQQGRMRRHRSTAQLSACASPEEHKSRSPSSATLEQAREQMPAAMAIRPTGDVDADFLSAMIPHQGAIDMARAELEHGRDPAVRALAQRIVDTQEAEIERRRGWLRYRGVPDGTVPAKEGVR